MIRVQSLVAVTKADRPLGERRRDARFAQQISTHRLAIVTIAVRPSCSNGQHSVERVMRGLNIDPRPRCRAPKVLPEAGR